MREVQERAVKCYRYPRRATTAEWRADLRELRQFVQEAKAARGKVRHAALVRAARIVVDLTQREPMQPRKFKSRERSITALELAVGTLAKACVGCLAMERLDGEPSKRLATAHRRIDRGIAEGRADYEAGRYSGPFSTVEEGFAVLHAKPGKARARIDRDLAVSLREAAEGKAVGPFDTAEELVGSLDRSRKRRGRAPRGRA